MSAASLPPPASLSVAQLIEAVRDGVVLTDREGRILAVNRAFCRVTGYARREVLGRNPRILQSGRHGRGFYQAMWADILRAGSWSGEIWNRQKSGRVYLERLTISAIKDAVGRPRFYLGVFADITRRWIEEQRLERQGRRDSLTDLPNRREFDKQLDFALNGDRRPGVVFIDLDRFKPINDRYGHAVGDLVLRAAAARLRGCLRRADLLARWGGDEFVVLLPGIDRRGAKRAASSILRVFRRPFAVHGHRLKVCASLGVCLPNARLGAGGLLRRADRAMYSAKRRGGDTVVFAPAVASRARGGGRRRR